MRHRSGWIALCLAVGLAGCAGNTPSSPGDATAISPATGSATAHLEVGGLTRDYRVVAPSGGAGRDALPLLLVLHWRSGTIDDVATATGFDALAQDPGVVVVYPVGYGLSWNAGTCCDPAVSDHVDDVGFLAALIEQTLAAYPIDPDRVYLWGASTGGQLAYRAACELSGRIAAMADVSGNMVSDCSPTHPVSIIDVHGTADTDVPYDGCADGTCPSIPDVMDRWRQLDGCGATPSTRKTAGTESTAFACQDGTAVTFIKAIGKGHDLAGIQMNVPAVTWAFLASHPRAEGGWPA